MTISQSREAWYTMKPGEIKLSTGKTNLPTDLEFKKPITKLTCVSVFYKHLIIHKECNICLISSNTRDGLTEKTT